ncbi:MAG: hypothetical protein IKY87_01855 [Paludibacteraceae bacterium]|nr:hypothetical protein [Paludibacteraceae bacterium]
MGNYKKALGWAGFGLDMFDSVANIVSTILTNKHNERMVDKQNAHATAESDKAYERSKATNQVGLMEQAGMSKAGALNAINGGGSYTPAPINTAQSQAPQVDVSGAIQPLLDVAMQDAQIKSQEDLQKSQIKAAEVAQAKQIASDEKKHAASLEIQKEIAQLQADTTNRNADNRLNFDKEQWQALESYRKEQERQLKISNDLQDRLSDINYQQAVENVGLTKAQKFLTYTQEDKLYEELQDFLDAADSRESARETQIAEDIVRQLSAATDFNYKYLTYEYINSLEGKERENAIIRAESWWRLAETRFGGVAQVLGKVAMAAGLIYFGKGAGLKWMQKLGAPKSAPIGFG